MISRHVTSTAQTRRPWTASRSAMPAATKLDEMFGAEQRGRCRYRRSPADTGMALWHDVTRKNLRGCGAVLPGLPGLPGGR